MGKINFTLEEYQESGRTYRKELLRLPILSLKDELKHMTLRPGVRYSEVVGDLDIDVELQPYVRNQIQDKDPDLILRELKTYFGTVNYEFDPNSCIQQIIGHRAKQAMAEGLETTLQAQEVMAIIPKKIGKKLKTAIIKGKRNPTGKTTHDLFDGFETIIDREIAAGNISAAKKNYIKLSAKPTNVNALDLSREILDAMSPELRAEETSLFCAQTFEDMYNRAYKMDGGCIVYNDKFEQTSIEGSKNLMKMVPLVGMADCKYMIVTTESNMLIGVDQMSDQENVRVKDYAPDTLTFMMRMFFGVEFESIDPRVLLIVEIPD